MMVSANDAAYAIAHTVGGNLDGFAADLNETAQRLGLRDSTLGDPAGLDDATSYKGGPFMSAYDLAIATRNALAVPAIAKWAAMHVVRRSPTRRACPHHLVNHNKMLPGRRRTPTSARPASRPASPTGRQHTLVATATRNGRTLIAVVLGAPDAGYAEAAALLDAGFAMPADARGHRARRCRRPRSRCTRAAPPTSAAFAKPRRRRDRDRRRRRRRRHGPPAIVPRRSNVASRSRAAPRRDDHRAARRREHSRRAGLLSLRNVVIVLILLGGRHVLPAPPRREAPARDPPRAPAPAHGGDAQRRTAGRRRPLPRRDALGPPVESHVRVRRVDDDRDRRDVDD